MPETVIINLYGDTAEQINGSTQHYAEYLAGYEEAEDKLEYNARKIVFFPRRCGRTALTMALNEYLATHGSAPANGVEE